MEIVVTTTHSQKGLSTELIKFLDETNFSFVQRENSSIKNIQEKHKAGAVIVWHEDGPVLHLEGKKFYYHPSMAKNRISLYRKKGIIDPLIKACKLSDGDKFLDCTLGLGADALVVTYFNSQGQTISLESSQIIATIVKWGMKLYTSELIWLDEAIKRIEVINSNYLTYLSLLADKSFDIIYFDPMFRNPLLKSEPLTPLRLLANHSPLSLEAIAEATRVARKRVVVKELARSGEFNRLGIKNFVSSPNNKIAFGIIDLE